MTRPRRRILSSSSTAAAVTPPLAPSAALTYDGLLSACRQIAKDDPKLDGFNIAIGPHVRGLAELRQDLRYLAAVRVGHLHDESGIIRVSKDALKSIHIGKIDMSTPLTGEDPDPAMVSWLKPVQAMVDAEGK
jgi:hypothetical protein